jgi:hypothetical protein
MVMIKEYCKNDTAFGIEEPPWGTIHDTWCTIWKCNKILKAINEDRSTTLESINVTKILREMRMRHGAARKRKIAKNYLQANFVHSQWIALVTSDECLSMMKVKTKLGKEFSSRRFFPGASVISDWTTADSMFHWLFWADFVIDTLAFLGSYSISLWYCDHGPNTSEQFWRSRGHKSKLVEQWEV